jgi:uncharacterized protein
VSSQAVPVATTTAPVAPQIADPAPLGLAGFAMTTMVLSVFNAGLLDEKLGAVVLPLAFFYGGLAQLLAGMWEFRKGNTFGALAFSSFGAFWLSYYLFGSTFASKLAPADQVHKAVGLFLLGWTIFTLYMTVAALRTSGAVLGVFVALELTFIFLTIGNFANKPHITHVGGWLGLVTALLAWYASFAGVVNATWGRTLAPTYPMLPGQVAVARERALPTERAT